MKSKFYPQTLYPKTQKTLALLHQQNFLSAHDFYLAGGTALALQLGHRLSIDLDWMSPSFTQPSLLLSQLAPLSPKIIQQQTGTLDVLINQTKVSFLQYDYPLVRPLINYENIKLAHILDIACMKLTAISSRGSRKDYIDLYFILQHFTLKDILQTFQKKYQGIDYSWLHLAKSLIYFDLADQEPEVDYLTTKTVDWQTVKNKMTQVMNELLASPSIK